MNHANKKGALPAPSSDFPTHAWIDGLVENLFRSADDLSAAPPGFMPNRSRF